MSEQDRVVKSSVERFNTVDTKEQALVKHEFAKKRKRSEASSQEIRIEHVAGDIEEVERAAKRADHVMEAMAASDEDCTIQYGTYNIPMKVTSIHHRDDEPVYKVANSSKYSTDPAPWMLPENLVIKTQRQDFNESVFALEGDVYSRLSGFQGRLIPNYYGVVGFQYGGKTVCAYMFEEVNGIPLTRHPWTESNRVEIGNRIRQAYEELSEAQVIHGDIEPRHIFVKEGRIVLIDFDQAIICKSKKEAESQNNVDLMLLLEGIGLI
ncbi:hypothetical protein IQ07DRAFT_637629 [Pyrenochaeta sp. DS3sAY3a]|nr:hypothetical protein IQ07DRAFT_637629 [Pyrenochaeta sp. DS3sAY3a]